ncbi:hypothetical protein TTRE_0000460801 [Trichuris trichiura]|uniref:Uncharacterized protein n=1 Tax=Trichuris trichiura TaxID=36087 RepID=A0A077Z7Y7_TRITR|nr:hypothetical protein TTRE_0000460801 [Trichuris trichiura]
MTCLISFVTTCSHCVTSKCFVKNLSKNSLSVLSGPVVVKLMISKLEVPVLISVRRNDIAQNLTSSNNIVLIGVEQVFSKLTTLLHELSACTVLSVHQWKEYAIQMRTDRLFPCEGIGISVSTRTPNCSSDVVLHQLRLLAIQDRLYSPIETKRRGIYVGEQRLQPGVSVVNFHCNYFDLIYPEYCFRMVSVLGDGFVQQHAQRCVSTELKTRVPIHGRWSAWKGWGSCSTGCNAVQHRFRFCDNPPPRFGGRFCEGVGMETARCNSSCHGRLNLSEFFLSSEHSMTTSHEAPAYCLIFFIKLFFSSISICTYDNSRTVSAISYCLKFYTFIVVSC